MKKQNYGQKMAYLQGADGRLYYNFPLGLKVLLREGKDETAEEYTLEIVGCHFVNGSGTEYYDIARDGVTQPYSQSANRVKYLLSRYGVKTLAEGNQVELPLLFEEVFRYYQYRRIILENTTKQAEAIPQYKIFKEQFYAANREIFTALARNRLDEVAALEKKRDELSQRMESVLRVHGLDPADLKEKYCENCRGEGYDAYGICDCALAQSDKIKAFCAAERLKILKSSEGN